MKLIVLNENRSAIIFIDEILTEATEKRLGNAYTKAVSARVRYIIFDFGGMKVMNNSGATLLAEIGTRAKRQFLILIALGLSDRYREVFQITGLSSVYRVHPAEEEALVRAGIADARAIIKTRTKHYQEQQQKPVASEKAPEDYWAPAVKRITVKDPPAPAVNLNMHGRRIYSPLQGFGPLWIKTYQLPLKNVDKSPEEMMTILKTHFPEFQPPENKSYPSVQGIHPGEYVLIDLRTPGGLVSTGVIVLYSDDTAFTLVTPQGHPEAGWVSFNIFEDAGQMVARIRGFTRTGDPFYECAFRINGARFQENIWRHVLTSFGEYLGAEGTVEVTRECPANNIQWPAIINLWYNAQFRTLLYIGLTPFRWLLSGIKKQG